MPVPENIFLVGPMGAGKTTIGRQLARSLGKTFRDSDQELERRTGAGIPLIFELEGEPGFRRREQVIIDELSAGRNLVLATGGGAVLSEQNRTHLIERGYVVYLSAPLDRLFERVRRDRNRPLLRYGNPRVRLETLFIQRDPLYREVADLIVKTDHRTVRSVVKELENRLFRI